MVDADRSGLGLGPDEQLLQVVSCLRTRITSRRPDRMDQGKVARAKKGKCQLTHPRHGFGTEGRLSAFGAENENTSPFNLLHSAFLASNSTFRIRPGEN